MKEKFSLKDALFNENKVTRLATEIAAVYPSFQRDAFISTVLNRFPELELKQRISWIREQLRLFLPKAYSEALRIILAALPPPLDPSKTDNDFGDFIYAPYGDFIAFYGCTKDNLPLSLSALREVTMRFSAEDAIRYFINSFPDHTISQLAKWGTDENYHVRRLVSEGTRPKLPWSQKIVLKPEQTIPLLDLLFADKTRYVTRSVANHLNDISKIKPELVLKTLDRWEKTGKQNPKEMEFIIKHSLRTLVKKGYPEAIQFLKFSTKPDIQVEAITLENNRIKMGTALQFSIGITALKDERLLVDYKLYFQGKTGGMNNSKVFKLRQCELCQGETVVIEKVHKLRKQMTTRTLYPGEHKLEIMVNGQVIGAKQFLIIP
jgi:3-methyladenine DNA glycosylase AlkC